jgi:hypothetical protein
MSATIEARASISTVQTQLGDVADGKNRPIFRRFEHLRVPLFRTPVSGTPFAIAPASR